MRTECTSLSMRFARLKGRGVAAYFGGGSMTSDARALLLGATDCCLASNRDPTRPHKINELAG